MNPNKVNEMKRMKLQEKLRPLRAHVAYRRAHPSDIEIWVSTISRGDLPAVKSLVKEGFKIYRRGACDVTGLMIASAGGHFQIVQFLLENRAYVNARDEMGYTALWRAVICEHPEIVRLLLEWGADPDMRDMFGWTALDYLCRMSAPSGLNETEFRLAQILVEFGATIEG
jgi:ankyrin repeat protein